MAFFRPRLRLLLVLTAIPAIVLGTLFALVRDDGGVAIEVINLTARPIEDVQILCSNGQTDRVELPPGASFTDRLWPKEATRDGRTWQGDFYLHMRTHTGTVERDKIVIPNFVPMWYEPTLRVEIQEPRPGEFGVGAQALLSPETRLSPTVIRLRKWLRRR